MLISQCPFKVAEAPVPATAVFLALFLIRQKFMSQNDLCAACGFAKLHAHLSFFHKIRVPGKDHLMRGINFPGTHPNGNKCFHQGRACRCGTVRRL